MNHYAQQILDGLTTAARRRQYELTHGAGSLKQLAIDAGADPASYTLEGVISRAEFDELTPRERMEFAKAHGTIV